jgi:hypothetical protein
MAQVYARAKMLDVINNYNIVNELQEVCWISPILPYFTLTANPADRSQMLASPIAQVTLTHVFS